MARKINNRGSVSNGVVISIGVHATLLVLLVFSSEIKQLPIINSLINQRTATDFAGANAIKAGNEEVTVSYLEPEKNPIKKVKEKTAAPKTKNLDNSQTIEPVKAPKKSKAKTLLAKAQTVKPFKKDILDQKKIEETPIENDLDNNDKGIEPQAIADESLPKQQELLKNPNPPAEETFSDKTNSNIIASVDGLRDGRRLKQMAGNPKPKYPDDARLRQDQGTVVLKYEVTERGSVQDIHVVESSGSPLLDDEAVNKVKLWRFKPGQAGETRHPVTFKLNGPSKQLPSRLRTSS